MKAFVVGFILLVVLVVLTPVPARAQTTVYAYIPNVGSNNVSVIETRSATVVGSAIATGASPQGAVATPDGRKVYISNAASSSVTVIDVATGTASAPINVGNVGSNPLGAGLLPDGKLYVPNLLDGTVTVIDTLPPTPS